MSSQNYYEVLQVPRTASAKAISAAYKKLARRYHPDHNPSPQATQIMQQINEAYAVLSHPQKRAVYDKGVLTRSSQAKIVVARMGAPVGIARKMQIRVDGDVVAKVGWGEAQTFALEPGRHTISVRLDAGTSPAVQFVCEAGSRLEFECGARSVFGSLFSSQAFYLRKR